jgi:hypothetical protein
MTSLNERILILENSTAPSENPCVFKITSNLNSNQIFNAGVVAKFDKIEFCFPNVSDFNTNNYTYTVPVSGIYQFTYKLYSNQSPSTNARFAINKNGSDVAISGGTMANVETVTTLESCNVGDVISVSCEIGINLSLWMSPIHSWFMGFLVK